jgi:hypothetical protein
MKPFTFKLIEILYKRRITLITLIVFVLACCIWYKKCEYDYNKDLWIIEESLKSIEEIDSVSMFANRDIVLEEIGAYIYLRNKGKLVIYDIGLNLEFLRAWEIGPYDFTDKDCQCKGFNETDKNDYFSPKYGIDIYGNNLLGHKLSRDIRNIRDLVISYDEIITVLDTMFRYQKIKPEIDSLQHK